MHATPTMVAPATKEIADDGFSTWRYETTTTTRPKARRMARPTLT